MRDYSVERFAVLSIHSQPQPRSFYPAVCHPTSVPSSSGTRIEIAFSRTADGLCSSLQHAAMPTSDATCSCVYFLCQATWRTCIHCTVCCSDYYISAVGLARLESLNTLEGSKKPVASPPCTTAREVSALILRLALCFPNGPMSGLGTGSWATFRGQLYLNLCRVGRNVPIASRS